MKKFAAAFLCIFLLLAASGCEAENSEKNYVYPPFFYVRDDETGGEAYMLGSFHAGLSGTVYPDEILNAFDKCEEAAFEVDIVALDGKKDEVNEAVKLFECENTTAKALMGSDYDAIKKRLSDAGLYNSRLENYLPVYWSLQLTLDATKKAGLESRFSTDRTFISRAIEKKIPVKELETCAEQYAVNVSQSPRLQLYSLKSSAEMPAEALIQETKALYKAWSNADSDYFEKLVREEVPDEYKDDYAAYYKAQYSDRQKKMAEYVISSLKSGRKILLTVGAAHFYASPDIPDFIEEEGYFVEVRS